MSNEAVKQRLEELAKAGKGVLTPEAVVEDAKKKDSPLHGYFTWDVKKAAYAHWLDQARTLITSVQIVINTETTMVKCVGYVRDPRAASGTQGYRAVNQMRTDHDMAREALVNEFSRVADLLRRARDLAVALDVAGEVDVILKDVVGLRQRFTNEGDSAVQ